MIDILMASAMLLPLLIVTVFWYAARKRPGSRRFVIPLAAGWAVGFIGSLVWGVHDMVASDSLPPLSWVDGFFILRDLLHLFAFLRITSAPMSRRRIVAVCGALLVAVVAVLVGYTGLERAEGTAALAYWGGAIYLVLGTAVLGVALMRWPVVKDPMVRRAARWVTAALLIYFAANVAQFLSLVGNQAGSTLALLLWPLSDLAALVGAISLARGRLG